MVLFSAMDKVTFAFLVPEVEDKVIQLASLVAVQSTFDVIEMLLEADADVTEMLEGVTVGDSTLKPF